MTISSITSGSVAAAPVSGTQTIAQTASTTPGGAGASVTPQTPTSAPTTQEPSASQVAQAVKQVNDSFAQNGQNLYASLGTDKGSGVTVVKIMDSVTHDVIGQYPSKAILAMADTAAQPKGGLININA